MAKDRLTANDDTNSESLTLWLPRAAIQKLNRVAKAKSSEEKLYTKQDVVRELVQRMKG